MLYNPSCVSSPPSNGASLSSISRVGGILHCEDVEYAAYITPSQGGEEEYTAYSATPPLLLAIEYTIYSSFG